MVIGDRIGAIQSANEDTVTLYGYGTYQGEEVPPKDIDEFLNEVGFKNPKLLLDNGNVVWGCQCWWGSEGRTKIAIAGRKVIEVSTEI